MNKRSFRNLMPWAALAMWMVCIGGCDEIATDQTRWFAPDEVVTQPKHATVSPVRMNVSLADESQELLPNATFPTEDDYVYSDKDYVIGPQDELIISIMDLYVAGNEATLQREVAESGLLDLPLLPNRVKAEGLTKEELRLAIMKAYQDAGILREPTISVAIAARRQNTFSCLGAIGRTGTYNILRKDMRLLEALALVGDVSNPDVHYIYIIRPTPAVRHQEPSEAAPQTAPAGEELPALPPEAAPPPASAPAAGSPAPAAASRPAEADLSELNKAMPGAPPAPAAKAAPGISPPAGAFTLPAATPASLPAPSALPSLTELAGAATSSAATSASAGELSQAAKAAKWVYANGRWVRVEQEAPLTSRPAAATPTTVRPANVVSAPAPKASAGETRGAEDPFGWKRVQKTDMVRIIAINYEKLKAGDPRMNIVIRDNDVIQAPPPVIGEFYLAGAVARPGVYSLTGRLITIKMAMAAAGNLDPLGWPRNSVLIRRVGLNQEQVLPIDIQAIFRGEATDFYLKPNDLVAVGSDWRTPFLAVMRNAFRISYGFGFVYDKNFDSVTPNHAGLDSSRFTRW